MQHKVIIETREEADGSFRAWTADGPWWTMGNTRGQSRIAAYRAAQREVLALANDMPGGPSRNGVNFLHVES